MIYSGNTDSVACEARICGLPQVWLRACHGAKVPTGASVSAHSSLPWHSGESTLQGIHGAPSTGGVAGLGLRLGRQWGPGREGLWKGKHTDLCKRHAPAGLEGSHQPTARGGFPREQLHLAPGHGNYC